jgi:CspA family cold shock protein
MSTGTVKWFNDAKGFGFIKPDDGTDDLFAHESEIRMAGRRTLVPGQRVQYRGELRDKGPVARDIEPIG